uniref:Uncharacterized protein LOC111110349 n=1 Tax=Crassostrea virginica TaxID=6565 RepID=A0A8B8BGY9_CRAVI|nr:uncharacterized protein LOC111110349 [Crassostrea virginica]XP_022302529.1 uncharacterized protein LOC111110349 [Crassostrea virginica]
MATSNIAYFSAQDVARCNICGSGDVKLYCTLCSLEMCEQCSTKHILSDPHKRHEVIAFMNKDFEPSPSGHKNYPMDYSYRCTRSDLEVLIQLGKLDLLSKEAEQIRSQTIPEMLRLEKKLKTQISVVYEAYKARITDIGYQSQMLHDAIDQLEKEYKTKLDQMRERDLRELEGQHKNIGSLISEAQQQLEQYNTSDTHQQVTFEFPLLSTPQPVQWTAPTFVPMKLEMEFVRFLFGTLTESNVQTHSEGPRPSTSTSNLNRVTVLYPRLCTCAKPAVKIGFEGMGVNFCSRCNSLVTESEHFKRPPIKPRRV